MTRSTRAGLRLTLVATIAALALLAPTLAVADEPGLTDDAPVGQTGEGSSSVVLQAVQDRLDSWTQLLRERLATEQSAGVDGKAGSLADTAPASSSSSSSNALLSDIECEDGRAAIWPCENVDLLSFVPTVMLGGANGNDLWGWTDPETESEYAVMGTGYGTAFIDVTEPTDPTVIAKVVTESADYIPLWRDVKVINDHALIVSEHGGHGMQVVDLTRLRGLEGPQPEVLEPDAVYSEFGNAHNIAVNEDRDTAYAVGTDTCEGGLHMIGMETPTEPQNLGCYAEDGYTHDVQCVEYDGPKAELEGNELCFASNEDTLTIVDVTDKDNPKLLAREEYDSSAYTHQGWLTPDHEWFIFGDELDESNGTVDSTTTYIMNVTDPESPGEIKPYSHETAAIDHNLYVDGDYVWQANYVAGLRILDYSGAHGEGDLEGANLDELGFFEVVPEADPSEFAGAWSVYPFFESGTVLVSTLEQGLFVLETTLDRPTLEDGDDTDGPATGPGRGQGGPPEDHPGRGEGREDNPGGGNGNGNGPQRTSNGYPGGELAWTA